MKYLSLITLVLILLFLPFEIFAGDKWFLNVPKKSIVVLKIPKSSFNFEKVSPWSGKSTYSANISIIDNNLAVNGNSDWKNSDWNLMTDFFVTDNKEAKKTDSKKNEVKLQNSALSVVLTFDSSVSDVGKSFDEIVFVGTLNSYEYSDYYKNEVINKFLPRIFSGRLAKLSQSFQLTLLKASNYETKNFTVEEYKGKYYFVIKDKANTYFNSVKLNQSQRVAYVFNNYLLNGFKGLYKEVEQNEDFDGVKIEYLLPFYNFVSNSDLGEDILQIYATKEEIKHFAEADVTGQDFLDKSVVIVNGNRTKIDLTLQ
jgi:hypothetical protein